MWNLILDADKTNPFSDPWTLGLVLVLIGAMVLFMVFSGRRRKQAQEQVVKMLDELRPGQRVRTVGGIIGRIKEIREESPGVKTVLLQTGNEKFPAYMLFDIQAIYGVFAEEGHTLDGKIITRKETQSEQVKTEAEEKEGKGDKYKDDIFNAREYVDKVNTSTAASSSKKKKK